MYEWESNIRYSEVDADCQLTMLALLDYFQDTTAAQSELLGIGVDYLKEHGLAWLLTNWQICVNRMPRLTEHVRIRTMPYELKGFYGLRNFDMLSESGEVLAYANTIWVMTDIQKGRPTRIPEELGSKYVLEQKLDMDYCSRRLEQPACYEEAEGLIVPAYFIDSNHHMNNSRYVEVAQEFLPEDFRIGELQVEYKKEAMAGEMIYPRISRSTENGKGCITVVIVNEKAQPHAIVRFLEQQADM